MIRFKTADKIVVLLSMCMLLLGLSAQASTNDRAYLQTLLQSYKTYQARFRQVTYNADGAVTARGQGKVYLRRPGMFRWESQTPTNQVLIANGKLLWVYDIDLQQATKRTLTDKDDKVAQLMVGDTHKILAQYKVAQVTAKASGLHFKLTPLKKNDNLFQAVNLYFKSKKLTSLSIYNDLDEYSKIDFLRIKINRPLSLRLFKFKPPAGVDVLR